MVKVTKAMVLGGTKHTVEVEVPELGGTMTLRPLNALEYAKYQQILMRNIKISGEKSLTKLSKGIAEFRELSLGDFLLNKTEAAVYALSRAIVDDEPWTREDVANLPSPVIDRLVNKVLELTGIGVEEQVKNFQKAKKGKILSV